MHSIDQDVPHDRSEAEDSGTIIRWTIGRSRFGPLLIAASAAGICRLTFDEGQEDLRRCFAGATLVRDDSMAGLADAAIAAVNDPSTVADLPLDLRGTSFQQAVWAELRRIPAGETRSYAELAAAVGQPGAVRAVGSANGANPVAVLVPCHRVIRSDGTLGGYAGGLDRKRRLLAAETSAGMLL